MPSMFIRNISPSIFRYGDFVIRLCNFVMVHAFFCYIAFVFSLLSLRYFVMVPSLFRDVAYVITLWSFRYVATNLWTVLD